MRMLPDARSLHSPQRLLLLIAAGGALASIALALTIFPEIRLRGGTGLVTDQYDLLARGLSEYGTLCFHPDPSPTVLRAPLFPVLLACCMRLAGERWELASLLLQALLHAVCGALVSFTAFRVSGRRAAIVAAVVCALHPTMLWYSSRLLVETTSTLLFTLCVLSAVRYRMRPTMLRAIWAGAAIGAGLWCKAVFAPLLLAVPAAMFLSDRRGSGLRDGVVALAVAVLIISPWLARNASLTGRPLLLQALTGFNMHVSDSFVEQAASSPFAYEPLFRRVDFGPTRPLKRPGEREHTLAWREARTDVELLGASLDRYAEDPGFLLKKIAWNAWWFWCQGSTRNATLLLGAMQGVLLLLVLRAGRVLRRRDGWGSPLLLPLWMAGAYMLAHLPVYAIGRFSVILVPSLVLTAVSLMSDTPPVAGRGVVIPSLFRRKI
jgi:4-amino-4-deoxy-L-arabinose transferase-like glycosyltransferase